MRKKAKCIFIAVDESVARDVAEGFYAAITALEAAKSRIAELEEAVPVEHELNDRRCACCGHMTYHNGHMGCIRAAATKMEGKVIVPVEPTHAMCLAGNSLLPSTHNADEVWQAMLAAAQECEQ